MDKFREFQGSHLDDCIRQAMEWFDCPREMLEIEIVQDAKSGIFGIVGARKAKIRAKRAYVTEKVRDLLQGKAAREDSEQRAPEKKEILRDSPPVFAPEISETGKSSPNIIDNKSEKKKSSPEIKSNAEKPLADADKQAEALKNRQPELQEADLDMDLPDADLDRWPQTPVHELDQEKLRDSALEIVRKLAQPLAGKDLDMVFEVADGLPRVKIKWKGDAGLLIGREGQTLAAIQYLASRILSRKMGAILRVQLDIGDYRARQYERLHQMAHGLAEKARHTGKPVATRPLSSYHRRLVHVCLQNERDIFTRSSGEGSLKRVIISAKRS